MFKSYASVDIFNAEKNVERTGESHEHVWVMFLTLKYMLGENEAYF